MARYGQANLSSGRVRTSKPLWIEIRELCFKAERKPLSDSEWRLRRLNETSVVH